MIHNFEVCKAMTILLC